MPDYDFDEPAALDPQADKAIVERALTTLREHFEAVQIFATRHRTDDEGTVTVNLGTGNWNARQGMVQRWLWAHDQNEREDAKRWSRGQADDNGP